MANRLVLELVADSNSMIRALNDVQKHMDSFTQSSSIAGRSLGGGVNQALEAFAGLAKGGAAAAGVLAGAFAAATSAAVAMTVKAGKIAEETDQLAQKTGISAAALEGLSVAMARTSLESSAIATGIKGLAKAMSEAGAGGDALRSLGVTMDIVEKGTGATMRAIADAFKRMPDGAEKARFAVELFGKAGLDLIPILNQGAAGLDAAMRKAAEFGVILTDTERGALTTFDDAMDDLGSAVKGFGMQVGIAFAPSLTALVDATTQAIVRVKDIFNQFADAGATLTIRLAGMAASLELMGKQLFSTSVLSAEAWKQTWEQVKAIDAWATAERNAVQYSREMASTLADLATKHMDAARAVAAHAASQQKLGEHLVKSAQIRRNWAKESSHDVFSKLFEEEDVAAGQRYAGPMATLEKFENAQRGLLAMHSDLQQGLDAQTQAYIEVANAADAALVAETAAAVAADERNQVYQGEFMRTQHIAAQAAMGTKTIWQQQLQSIVDSNVFSVGQIVSGWTSGLANAIVNFENFGQTMTQIGKQTAATLLQGILNLGVQSVAQWLLQASQKRLIETTSSAQSIAIHTGMESAKTTITATQETARTALALAATNAIASGSITMLAAIGAVANATVGVLAVALEGIVGFMMAVAASVAKVPIVGQILAGAIIVGATMAQVAGSVALTAALVATNAALASGTAAATAAMATPFASGGIATGPTMGMVGEAGSSEAIIPLNKRGAAFMRETLGMGDGKQSVIQNRIYLDGREIAIAMSDRQPSALRLMGALS